MAEHREPRAADLDERVQFVTRLFAACRRSLLRYVTDLLSRREDAEDVVQETYVRLLNAANLELAEGRARAYMYKTATNIAYDRFRERRTRGHESDDGLADLASDAPSPERVIGLEQGVEIVKQTLLALPPRCRQVFLMRVTEELGYDEIAARLQVSKRTVEREMQHALEACQRRLQPGDRR
jgi:RNA polymerase sigma factor (sigma-70 family)